MLDIVISSGISIRLCSILYIMLSLNFSSCLEGVPLEVFKKLGYCSWFSRIIMCTKSGSLSFGFFLRF